MCFWDSGGTFCVVFCAHCLWSFHWEPLKGAWHFPLCSLTAGIYKLWQIPPKSFSSPDWTVLGLSHISLMWDAQVPNRFHWTLCMSMSPFYWGAQSWTQHTHMWPHQGWLEGKDHLPQPAGNTSSATLLQGHVAVLVFAWSVLGFLCCNCFIFTTTFIICSFYMASVTVLLIIFISLQ